VACDVGVIRRRLDELAVDIGRLRRRLDTDREVWTDLDVWTLEQIGAHVADLAGMFEPTAAELANTTAPGDPDAITEALRIVDARARAFRVKLGLEAAA
jgi:hypothetical protein